MALVIKKIPLISFASIQNLFSQNFIWLISGTINGVNDVYNIKKFLMDNGVAEDNIVNFNLEISMYYIANLSYIEKHGADFFATGISYAEVGLDLKYIPYTGVNFAGSNQDLRQGYLTAKYIFEHVKPGTIKFVLIGLAPYSFRYDNPESFSVCPRNLQYMFALNAPPQNVHDNLLLALVSDNVKNIFTQITAEHADLNFDGIKNAFNGEIPAKSIANWELELKALNKKFRPKTVEKNLQILKDYIKLCLANGAKPVGVVLPFAPAARKNFDEENLTLFRLAIRQLEESYEFKCIDLFDMQLGYDCFYNMAHLNLRGATLASLFLGVQMYDKNILSAEDFCGMSYDYFELLSQYSFKDSYNYFIGKVFEASAEMIRRKNKIKIGFVTRQWQEWCGDKLYNLFATDKRFEVTIFDCKRTDIDTEADREDFLRGVEEFKKRGLNVVAVSNGAVNFPAQDVLIYLTPYFDVLPVAFRPANITAKTLITYIPYGFEVSTWNIYNTPIYHLAWKLFFDTRFSIQLLEKECRTGMPRGLYAGYSRTDIFFDKGEKFHFGWKLARPDAKKIIYAPHWSIASGVFYATFQYNYKFMYEFAKAHPEISWVVKPHPMLLATAVGHGVFPSDAAFKDYMQKWDDLPNAQIYTGAYYQDLFATSDGMIMDCGSWIGEYQYTHKPMIFLTRDTQKFNELGNELMKILYRVDGRNLNAIGALMQKVFIEGKDDLFNARMKFFDEHLNYMKANGMTASEFIFKTLSKELRLN